MSINLLNLRIISKIFYTFIKLSIEFFKNTNDWEKYVKQYRWYKNQTSNRNWDISLRYFIEILQKYGNT